MTRSLRWQRWRGLADLVTDVVAEGSSAVERVHLATAHRSLDVLAQIPPLALPARGVRAVHDLTVTGVYGAIRLVTRAVGGTIVLALDVAEKSAEAREEESAQGRDERAPPDGA